ncbi:MAG: DUF1501 domain-containing protein [Lentisphaeraceae bacterium]|nr:DUF1501 domain-containing protein [Lentisphaeraceae bacterium]
MSIARRHFLKYSAGMLGALASGNILKGASGENPAGVSGFPGYSPKAKRVIFLFQAGGPSQIDLLDYKPHLKKWHGKDLPKSVMGNAKFTGMVSGQSSFPVVSSPWGFKQYGKSGAWVSDLMPEFGKIVDDVCIINSMTTTQVEHGNAINMIQTGHQLAGRPCAGAWASYGLGSACDDLPSFVVMRTKKGGSFIQDSNWGAGFLPGRHQGIKFGGAGKDPVYYLSNPQGIDQSLRNKTIGDIRRLNDYHNKLFGDPEINARTSQFEMAARMQLSVPELADLSDEPESTFKLYGEDARVPGTYAYSLLMARRLAERGVRWTQIFQGGWDQHSNLPRLIQEYSAYTDRANAALVIDLKQRGLLDDTLVIWGGEFGRTNFCQGTLTKTNFGREHHAMCFSMWMAGGGVKPGTVYGKSDEWGFRVAEDAVPTHDLYATILHLLGVNHERLTYKFQGRDYRLTDLYGKVVKGVLA